MKYYWFAMFAYIRGWLGVTYCKHPCCTTELNGKGEAKSMYLKQGWVPFIYRRVAGGGLSRTFITRFHNDQH